MTVSKKNLPTLLTNICNCFVIAKASLQKQVSDDWRCHSRNSLQKKKFHLLWCHVAASYKKSSSYSGVATFIPTTHFNHNDDNVMRWIKTLWRSKKKKKRVWGARNFEYQLSPCCVPDLGAWRCWRTCRVDVDNKSPSLRYASAL